MRSSAPLDAVVGDDGTCAGWYVQMSGVGGASVVVVVVVVALHARARARTYH
jgi:hypothetical protein